MSGNDNIRGRVSDAGEDESAFDLVVVEEAAVGLVDKAFDDFAGAGGARSSPTRVRKLDPFLFSLVQDVDVVGTYEHHRTLGSEELDLVGGHGGDSSAAGGAALEAEERVADIWGKCPKARRRLTAEERGAHHGAGDRRSSRHIGGERNRERMEIVNMNVKKMKMKIEEERRACGNSVEGTRSSGDGESYLPRGGMMFVALSLCYRYVQRE